MCGVAVWDSNARYFYLDGEVQFIIETKKPVGKDFTIHQYVGLKDIDDKKIYADSSIVEFEFGTISNKKLKGYFKYSNYTLSYHIILVDDGNRGRAFKFDAELMYDIKIIDTIQENKLNLIKEIKK